MIWVGIQSEIWNKNEKLRMLVSVIIANHTSMLEKCIVLHLLEKALGYTTLNWSIMLFKKITICLIKHSSS